MREPIRSVIFYTNDEQKETALAYIQQLNHFLRPIVTQVVPSRLCIPPSRTIRITCEFHPDDANHDYDVPS